MMSAVNCRPLKDPPCFTATVRHRLAMGGFYLAVTTPKSCNRAVRNYLNGGSWELMGEFTEVKTAKGGDANRAELGRAFAACRIYGAKLRVAKLDRLSRDAHWLLGLEKRGIDF